MRYVSDDGKVFNTKEECLRHESELIEAQKRKVDEEAKAMKIKDEIENKLEKLGLMVDEYNKLSGKTLIFGFDPNGTMRIIREQSKNANTVDLINSLFKGVPIYLGGKM